MTVLVIGAGVVGCAIAFELASRGARVRIVDRRGTGQGATRASAGILAPTIEGHVPLLLDLGVRSLALYDEFLARASDAARQPVEYERSGTLQVAFDSAEAEGLTALARTFTAADVGHSLMDGADARHLEPSLPANVVNALMVPQHGYVAVGPLTQALARAAVNLGATLAVDSIPSLDGDLGADAVVVATGSWTDQLLETAPYDLDPNRRAGLYAPPIVKPIRGQLLQLRLTRRAAARVIWGRQCYAVPWQDGSVLLGATVEDVGFDESATVEGVQGLLTEGVRLLPLLAGAAFEEVRTGLRPMTRDELPAVGPSSTMPGVFYATGHYRNGVLLAPLTAMLMADLLLEGRAGAALAALSPARFGL